MVQVDVSWSYGIGAGFAMANTWQLEKLQKADKSAYEHTSFRDTLLFLGCLFVPSGAFLIWQFPSWETMHVATRDDIPGWLMAGFTITNFTQGILGFAVAAMLLRRGHKYAAYLQWLLGYFGMLFILVHGWDGTGYMRFLSSTRADFEAWTWVTAQQWLIGSVAQSLMAMGVVILPVMFWLMARDLRRGHRLSPDVVAENAERISATGLASSLLGGLLGGVLGAAILGSVAIRYLGPVLGTGVFVALVYVVGLRPGGLFYRHFRHVVYCEPLIARSARPSTYQAGASASSR